ncbi:trypsin-like peptidase domain-containing protein [Kitasatospora sp. NPDC058965]|uniref:VMAP-C domain-containing protein n=1 Tax=Kitasatospora sp. NPDC058965 TaxID=3346682 RepID=UPI00369BD987
MRKPNPLALLQALLEQCRVSVRGAADGAGFFVAPGFAVSCAHVTGSEPGTTVRLHWAGADHEAVVRAASAGPVGRDGALYPFPDLAVLELLDPPADHPCVWLDPEQPAARTALTATGFTDLLERGGAAPRTVALTAGGRTAYQGHPLLELVEGEVNPGLSGGPVLSHATGGVCAVVKATRLEDSSLGGFAVPSDALRLLDAQVYRTVIEAHDRFHAVDRRWHSCADLVEGAVDDGAPAVRAAARRFLGLLAGLPDEPSPRAAAHGAAFLAAAAPGTALPERPLLARRDVYTELAARLVLDDEVLPYELAYCADLARDPGPSTPGGAAVRGQLRDHVLITAGWLGLGEAARERLAGGSGPAPVPSVIGRIRHSLRDRNLYHVTVWRYRSPHDIVPGAPDSPALPLREALARLAELLPGQIELMEATERPGLIELILPQEALDEDFAGWQLWPDWSFWRLGCKYRLVVRPLERQESPQLQHAWTQRWQQLAGKPVGESLVCVCGRDRQHQAALDATFNNDPTLAALALAGSPGAAPVAEAYRVAVASGVPMMVWRQGTEPRRPVDGRGCQLPGRDGGCGLPGRTGCPDGGFLAQARAALAGTERDDVPARILALRNAAQTDEAHEEHVGARVVLLWDAPDRRIPRTTLAPAAPAEEGRTP